MRIENYKFGAIFIFSLNWKSNWRLIHGLFRNLSHVNFSTWAVFRIYVTRHRHLNQLNHCVVIYDAAESKHNRFHADSSSHSHPGPLLFPKKIRRAGRRLRIEKSELPWEHKFYSHRSVSCRTISLTSFNGLCCKLTEIALFICFI